MATETEVKIEVDSQELDRVRRRLAGESTPKNPRQEEQNVLYDQDGRLAAQGCTLRLRSYGGRSILTFKGPVDATSLFKRRPEFQTEVEGRQMREILVGLGFEPLFRYDKHREIRNWTFQGSQIEVCLDETPVGLFVELEGDPSSLEAAAQELGWSRDRFIKKSYVEIYKERLSTSDREND